MLRFCSLGSGSGGNATIVEARSGAAGSSVTRVLLDCGFTLRELDQRLARIGLASADIDAVFVTHEHGDHIGSAVALSRRDRTPLWMSRGTWQAVGRPDVGDGLLRHARDGEPVQIGGNLLLEPYTVPHDAREPLQLCFVDGGRRLGVLTDAGAATDHLRRQLEGCQALLLECNHDVDLLAASRYPASVRARIGGRLGHLSNATAADILRGVAHADLRHVVAAHLSRENNRPALARAALAAACIDRPQVELHVADPLLGQPWLEVVGIAGERLPP